MNTASVVVLVVVLVLAAFAVWRVFKKGAPCECGGSKSCGGCCNRCGGQVEK